jgi:diguanylate cyclase (GGDEF)-like protein/PAS domain S-box-containing protein
MRIEPPMSVIHPPEALLFDESPVPMAIGNPDGLILRANRAFSEVIGTPIDELLGQTLEQFRVQDTEPRTFEHTADGILRVDRRFQRPDGRTLTGRVVVRPFVSDAGESLVLGCFIDDTARVEAERRMRYEAFHDRMTGLPNRALFLDRLGQALLRDAPGSVVVVGIDRMRSLNEAFGHSNGDRVVVEVGRRLQGAVGRTDTVARIGGDEFALLIAGELDETTAMLIQAAATPPLTGDLAQATVTASVGTRTLKGLEAPELVLGDAILAVHRAKELGRNRVVHYEPDLRGRASRTADIARSLTHAVERGEIDIDFQGIHKAGDGALSGFEALVRWRKSSLGLVPPVEFIPVAEQRGLILAIGEEVLRLSLEQLRVFRARSPRAEGYSISVNVSPVQVRDRAHMRRLLDIVERSGVPPSALKIEVTESVFVDLASDASDGLLLLRELGVQLYLDDFGTGYSSLHHLTSLRFDGLKADRSFVMQAVEDERARTLLRSIVQLARGLEMSTVAEGVETPAQAQLLREAGFDLLQGYLFHRPEPASGIVLP